MPETNSYPFVEKECAIWMNNLTPDNLALSQVIPTIKRMYQNGANDMDTKWRIAIAIYAKRHNIPFSPGMMNEMLNILNTEV